MSNEQKPKKLNLAETVRLLGAEPPEPLEVNSLNPIGLRAVTADVKRRLAPGRGRPTDKSWEISRKVPMKRSLWEDLASLAEQIEEKRDVKVAPGQLAAMALEKGVAVLVQQAACFVDARIRLAQDLDFPEDERDEAQALCMVASNENYW